MLPSTAWPKGVSGNPGGRVKEKPITEAYRRIQRRTVPIEVERLEDGSQQIKIPALDEYFSELIEKGRISVGELTALQVSIAANKGDLKAAIEVTDRTEGKVPQGIVGKDEDTPLIPEKIEIILRAAIPTAVQMITAEPSSEDEA